MLSTVIKVNFVCDTVLIVFTLLSMERRPAGDGGRPQNHAPHTASGRSRPVGDWPPTGAFSTLLRQSGMRAFHWWRSGNKKRTQNVSEYMLVLALCLVLLANMTFTFAICYRPSICLSSVTFVRPTQAVQIFRNISTALGTLAIL